MAQGNYVSAGRRQPARPSALLLQVATLHAAKGRCNSVFESAEDSCADFEEYSDVT